MIHVECPSCSAPYDLDERRLPASGLKMRCPKCGASFHVGTDGSVDASAVSAPPPAPTRKPTMVGLAPPSIPAPPAKPVPAPPPPIARPAPKPPAPDLSDLPAPRGAKKPIAPDFGDLDADLPAPRGAKKPIAPDFGADLPAPRGAKKPIAPDFGADLPAPRGAKKPIAPDFDEPDDLDLPAPRAAKSPDFDLDLPAPRAPKPPAPRAASPASDFDLDLPAPRGPKPASDFDLDLPAPRAKPASDFDLDLPAPRGAKAPEFDLDLPAPRGAASPAPDFDLDLPAPRGAKSSDLDLDLPAPRGGNSDFELDLPAPRGGSSDLDLDLPAPRGGGLDLDLPAPRSQGFDLDLPAARSVDLPAVSHGSVDLPMPSGASRDLPAVSKGIVDLPAPTPFDDFDSELPVPRADFDLPQVSQNVDLPARTPFDSDLPDFDDDLALPPPRQRTPDGRAGAGGAGFGELDLGGGDDGLEFDAIPESVDEPSLDADLDLPPSEAPPPKKSAKQRVAPAGTATTPKRRTGLWVLVAVLLLGVGVGVALKWTPYGLFGMYYAEQFRSEAGDPARVDAALEAADAEASSDTYGGMRAALRGLADARREMFLSRKLLARSAVYEALYQVRFGEDSRSEGREERILERLHTRSDDAPGMELALAAHELREGNLSAVEAHLASSRAELGDDPLVHLVKGELALAEGDPETAMEAFQSAASAGAGARAQWGIARAATLLFAEDEARAAIDATLEASPGHAGALVAKARRVLESGDADEAMRLARAAAGGDMEGNRVVGSPHERAAAWTLIGEEYERRGRRGEARTAFESAVELQPFGFEALLGLGRLGLSERRFRDSLTQFEAAEQAAGDRPAKTPGGMTPAASARLGQARALMALDQPLEALAIAAALAEAYPENSEVALRHGQALAVQEQNEAAVAELERAIALEPSEFEPYLGLAQLYFTTDQTALAGPVLDRARQNVTLTATVHRMLGDSALQRGRLEEATTEFEAALAMEPADPASLFGLGVALRRRGRVPEAAVQLERVSELDPSFPGLSLERGRIFEALGQADRAVASYAAAAADDPENLDLLVRLGGAQVAAGQLDEAEATLQRVQADRQDSAEVAYFLGRIDLARDQVPAALNHLSRAVLLDGSIALYRLHYARAQLESNQLGRAAEEIARALELDESLGEAYLLRGLVSVRTGAVRDAVTDLRRALELQPGLAAAHAGLGDAFAQLANRSDAIREFERAVAADATHGEWWYKLARVRADAGQRGEALPALERAIALAADVESEMPPQWVYESLRLKGDALWSSNRAEATAAYRRYLERAPQSALDRSEVERRLAE